MPSRIPDHDHTPPTPANESPQPTGSDIFEYPQTISPAEIGEYISFDQCPRYFKHRVEDHDSSWFHDGEDFTEAFRALNLLLSKAGYDFERTVLDNISTPACELTDLQRDVDEFTPDHETLIEAIAEACNKPPAPDTPAIISQASVAGTIGVWNVGGDIDLVFVWATETGATVRIVDIKRASEEKSYHQIQAATYVALLEDLLATASTIEASAVTVDAGIITQENADIPPTTGRVPVFEVAPRVMDIKRLLSSDGELQKLAKTDFDEVSYQLNQKCANCPYNESCLTDAYEEGHLRLLGLTVAQQELLASHGVESVSDLASLCQPPDDDDWYPTKYRRGRNGSSIYQKLETTPGIGELLPTLIYRAQVLEDQLQSMQRPDTAESVEESSRTGVSDRPRPWIPGTGRCGLPDDEPENGGPFETEWLNGSMIRVYLNVQHDHLRDRVLQISARVTATASVTESQRLAVASDDAPDVGDGADEAERKLLTQFIREVYEAIRAIEAGIDYTGIAQTNPLLHCYLYDTAELSALQDAFRRHDDKRIDSFQDLIEGDAGKDRPMVSVLQPIINQHLQLPTPAIGLLTAYRSLLPPKDTYRKSPSNEEWSYTPDDSSTSLQLRQVFSYRLFNRTVSGNPDPDGHGSVDPTSGVGGSGVPTRMRYDASIPLGYLWSAVNRIDSEWVESVREEYSLGDYPLDAFRYRNTNDATDPITLADVKTLGRHFCDVLEHIERSFTVKDATLEKEPYPIEALSDDSFEPPTLAQAGREYLRIEHSVGREEEYAHYRMQQQQRLLSGNTLPVQITSVDEVTDQTALVTGRVRYDNQFLNPENAERVKRACRLKGSDGSSSGSWMVANEWRPGQTDELVSIPYNIETGVQTTIKSLDLDNDKVEFTMKNFWGSGTEFARPHDKWTTSRSKATSSSRHLLLENASHLLLDPQTDDINAARVDNALEHAEENALHDCLERIRYGQDPAPNTDLFSPDHLKAFSEFMSDNVDPSSLPSNEQQSFIKESDAQIVGLQGPPGTGKTDGAFAPALMARAWDRSRRDLSFAGLVTAPSNTAIDELLESVAELYTECKAVDPSTTLGSVEMIRITSDKPSDAPDPVTYLDYNNPEDDAELSRLGERLLESNTGGQGKLTDFDGTDNEPVSQTLVFATPSRAWKLIDEITPGDTESAASEAVWHLLTVDEASMMTVPQFLLAGFGFRPEGQALVGGDHRQLPPVQKHDWSDEQRRSIRATVPYLSALDYLRVLRGEEEDILGEDAATEWVNSRDASAVEIPFIQLSTTYRFGHTTAALAQETVYGQDNIEYTAGKPSDPLSARSNNSSGVTTALSKEAPITLITYEPSDTYQQANPIEEAISAALIAARPGQASAGVVTPHNAQKSRLQTTIYNSDVIDANRDTVQIETVNRFQGGEADLMVLSGTVADPQYIRKEADFLLTETRVNVAMTRHKRNLVVIAPQSLLGYIPTDPDLYDDATIWKTIAGWAGEAPTSEKSASWSGSLQSFLNEETMLSRVPEVEHDTEIHIHQIEAVKPDNK
ncbi:AAA domain-containing protein [Natronomonas amylolytica]|uniref:AAA domain-containing protein n=1 Tax=Natronomonas amylolytica TaxID=3108498 RepID=UPI0030083A11